MTEIPRQGSFGIALTKSELEVDEGIAASLSKNDSASHDRPRSGDKPARKTFDRLLDADVAQRPVRENHEESDDADLQHFARGKNRVGVRVPAEHAAQHSSGGGEVGGPEKNPGETDCEIGDKTQQNFHRESIRPCLVREERFQSMFYHQIEAVK